MSPWLLTVQRPRHTAGTHDSRLPAPPQHCRSTKPRPRNDSTGIGSPRRHRPDAPNHGNPVPRRQRNRGHGAEGHASVMKWSAPSNPHRLFRHRPRQRPIPDPVSISGCCQIRRHARRPPISPRQLSPEPGVEAAPQAPACNQPEGKPQSPFMMNLPVCNFQTQNGRGTSLVGPDMDKDFHHLTRLHSWPRPRWVCKRKSIRAGPKTGSAGCPGAAVRKDAISPEALDRLASPRGFEPLLPP